MYIILKYTILCNWNLPNYTKFKYVKYYINKRSCSYIRSEPDLSPMANNFCTGSYASAVGECGNP